MCFQIYSGERFIGSSDLVNLDPPMGIASGDFLPSEGYHTVQPVFRLYAEATVNGVSRVSEAFGRYYRERDDLGLTVWLPSGEIVPMRCVHIEDFSVELGEIGITIEALNWQTFVQHFESSAGTV